MKIGFRGNRPLISESKTDRSLDNLANLKPPRRFLAMIGTCAKPWFMA